jgi:hypothetical protein
LVESLIIYYKKSWKQFKLLSACNQE